MIKNKVNTYLKIALFFCVVVIIVLSIVVHSMDRQIKGYHDSFNRLNKDLNDLKIKYEKISSEKADLEESYSITKETVESVKEDLLNFEYDVRDSMKWFTSNNNIKNLPEYKEIRQELDRKCVDQRQNNCKIKASCIPFVTGFKRDISYKYDEETSGSEDFLQNLTSINENSGGDCEDLSLLFVASYNYLVDSCLSDGYSRDQIEVESWQPGFGSHDLAYGTRWYLDDAETVYFENNYNYAYVVCGDFPGELVLYSEEELVGHCIVAIGNSEIKKSGEINLFLNNAYYIEPQEFAMVENNIEGFEANLYLVITQNDLMYYDWIGDLKWTGYADFLKKVQQQRKELSGLN